jgi:hypothetical protein
MSAGTDAAGKIAGLEVRRYEVGHIRTRAQTGRWSLA